MNFSENLTFLIKRSDITLIKLSIRTSIPKSTIHNWTSGTSPQNLLRANQLANYFGITLQDLIFSNLKDDHYNFSSAIKIYQER